MDEELKKLFNCGFIFLDKPRGPSSHEITAYIKKFLNLKKVGQQGTLDPQASGVLIIALNKATRLLRFLAKEEKTYVGVMKVKLQPSSIEEIQKVFNHFVGTIKQIPPLESAVAKKERIRKVYSFIVLENQGKKILFQAKVQAGTYIRKLCQEVGKFFGEGKLVELRRTSFGFVSEYDCSNLYDLIDAYHYYLKTGDGKEIKRLINPPNKIILLPSIIIEQKAYESVCRGLPLARSDVATVEGFFVAGQYLSILDKNKNFLAIAIALKSSQEIAIAKKEEKIALLKIVLTNAEVA
ncbi:MAG: RNA-guided pseudouridylation complex pseudouridine synthase subunit Cbf5 [Candidatus Anstonellaceae archaeon]